jgi:hypothetical protein
LAERTGLSVEHLMGLASRRSLHLIFGPGRSQGGQVVRPREQIRKMLENGELDITERRTLSGHEAAAAAMTKRYAHEPLDPRAALLEAHRRRAAAVDELVQLHEQRYGETP